MIIPLSNLNSLMASQYSYDKDILNMSCKTLLGLDTTNLSASSGTIPPVSQLQPHWSSVSSSEPSYFSFSRVFAFTGWKELSTFQ